MCYNFFISIPPSSWDIFGHPNLKRLKHIFQYKHVSYSRLIYLSSSFFSPKENTWFLFSGQEMFERIDKEEDGEVYLREVVDFLAVLDNNIEQSHQVRLGLVENDKRTRA